MPAPTALPEFLSLVRESGLWDESRYHEVAGQLDELPPEPAATAARLVEHGYLTGFQAKQLLLGKHRGFVLGSYRLLEPLAAKGGGTHYLAEHVGLKRRVVVKMLPPNRAGDKRALERFFREARAVAALDHPNILRLHDIGEANGAHFLVLEKAEGEDLQARLSRDGALRPGAAVALALQAAEGLRQAHDLAIVHRDVRPFNLFVCEGGLLKVRGMGMARAIDAGADDLTKLLGAGDGDAAPADYLAPEQALGDPVDARCDVYGLGATLYALLCGRPPFEGSIPAVLMQHQTADAPPLVGLVPGLPPALGAAVARMTTRAIGGRPASMAEVTALLTPFADKPLPPPKPRPAMVSLTPSPKRKSSLSLSVRPEVAPPAKPRRGGRETATMAMLAAITFCLAAVAARLLTAH